MAAGARLKISGAGGGGFMMIAVHPASRYAVVRALEPFGGRFFSFPFVEQGAQRLEFGTGAAQGDRGHAQVLRTQHVAGQGRPRAACAFRAHAAHPGMPHPRRGTPGRA